MNTGKYYNPDIETMGREELDSLVEERIRYTVDYAAKNSLFYKKWFRDNNIKASEITSHEDLLNLPVISGKTMRES
ncbi:MAG: coenzyme F390 synthetase, partial [Methanolobus sp.]|nr:coenzyme F390 synthetase [Methanolobus sp.]